MTPSTAKRLFASALLIGLAPFASCSSGEDNGEAGSGGIFGLFGSGEKAPPKTVEINHEDYAKLGYRIDWTGHASVEPGASLRLADLLGDVVVAYDTKGTVSVLSTANGAQRWATLSTDLPRFLGAVRSGRQIIAATHTGAQFFDADTGALLDKQAFERVILTHPVMVGPVLLFGTTSNEVLAHLTLNRFRIWGYALSGQIRTDPLVIGDEVVFTSDGGDVIGLDGQTGNSRWRARMHGGTAAGATPATSGDAVYVASLDQSVYCFERFNGATRWRYRTDSALQSAPTHHEGRVYVAVPSLGLTALDAKTGRPAWSAEGVQGRVIAVRNNRLVVWDGRTVTTLEMDGSFVHAVNLPGVVQILTDRFVDGAIYVVRTDGSVSRFSPR